MSAMDEAYLAAMAKSYSNQEGGVTIPADQLNGVVEIPLGFQPLGISARRSPFGEGDDVLIAAYFEPAICRAKATRDDNAGLHLAVDWIRGVNHGIQSVRLFPDISQPGGANRAQCVFYGPNNTICVSRNGERNFYMLMPPEKVNGRWTLARVVSGYIRKDAPQRAIHSAIMRDNGALLTIESPCSLGEDWSLCDYPDWDDLKARGEARDALYDKPIAAWRYGIAVRDGKVWTVTDYRQDNESTRGIYRDDNLVLPSICGNGIAFLSDGSALVTRYGQSYPGAFNGIPGALIYIPANYLHKP